VSPRKFAGRRQPIPSTKAAGKHSPAQPRIHLTEKRFAASRKWYRRFHRKWLYENTTQKFILAPLT
jgi:hypothetical protein